MTANKPVSAADLLENISLAMTYQAVTDGPMEAVHKRINEALSHYRAFNYLDGRKLASFAFETGDVALTKRTVSAFPWQDGFANPNLLLKCDAKTDVAMIKALTEGGELNALKPTSDAQYGPKKFIREKFIPKLYIVSLASGHVDTILTAIAPILEQYSQGQTSMETLFEDGAFNEDEGAAYRRWLLDPQITGNPTQGKPVKGRPKL